MSSAVGHIAGVIPLRSPHSIVQECFLQPGSRYRSIGIFLIERSPGLLQTFQTCDLSFWDILIASQGQEALKPFRIQGRVMLWGKPLSHTLLVQKGSPSFDMTVATSPENFAQLLASAMAFGYFLKASEQRMMLENSLPRD